MSERMNPDVKAKWLTALRSGDYVQARNDLLSTDGTGEKAYCCLGVLCDLYQKDVGGRWSYDVEEQYALFLDAKGAPCAGSTLTHEVHRWAGAPVSSVALHAPGTTTTLANLNDNGRTFL